MKLGDWVCCVASRGGFHGLAKIMVFFFGVDVDMGLKMADGDC